ncbi:NUDIX hydrolase [Candidatus Woesearchaeota archaeon]|nr:NUDIX hydrolase [Candidatus Woesearchaeota archaeon]
MDTTKPLSVAISALIQNSKILLIKRIKGDYMGFLGLPGGKVELNEHISEAAIREIFEESKITSTFDEHLGIVSELLVENNKVQKHFILHICKLTPTSTEILEDKEGQLKWYDLNELEKLNIIPSDYEIIKNLVLKKEKNYFNCISEKEGDNYILRKFI